LAGRIDESPFEYRADLATAVLTVAGTLAATVAFTAEGKGT
jgi:hypothetical protein